MIAGGILYGLSFPVFDLDFLIFASLAIFIHLVRESKSIFRAMGRAYLMFLTASIVAISWISLSGMQENADRFLIFAGLAVLFVYPVFFMPAAALTHFLFKSTRIMRLDILPLLAFPFVWTAFEYISTWGQITFPWLLAGNSQTGLLSKIQFIEYTGVYGLSFWISFIGMLLYSALTYSGSGKHAAVSLASLIAAITLYFVPDLINPAFSSKFSYNNRISIGMIQPNIDPWKKWGGKQDELIDEYVQLIRELHDKDSSIKMAVLPETAFPYYFREFFFERSYLKVKNACDSLDLPVLAGTPDLDYYEPDDVIPEDARIRKQSGEKFDTYNSAVLFEPGSDKNNYDVYHKIKLVPGSERMPYQEHVPFIKDLIEWGVGLGSWQIGRDTILFEVDGKKFNAAICYESVFPGFFAEFVRRGAEFSVIITNDGWWGKLSGTYQHSRYAVLRAIENRRWIVRCANTGISSFIDPEGVMHDETGVNVRALLARKIGSTEEKTFYTLHGDLFADVCIWFSLAAVVFAAGAMRISPKARGRRP